MNKNLPKHVSILLPQHHIRFFESLKTLLIYFHLNFISFNEYVGLLQDVIFNFNIYKWKYQYMYM